MPYCIVKNTKAYYEEEGHGDVMLLVHGAAQDTLSWRFAVPYLSERYRTIAVDLPGHGKSLRYESGLVKSLDEYAEFLNELIDVLQLKRVIIVGHSMAGGTALKAGLNRPDQIRAVIPLDGAGTTKKEAVSYNDEILDLITVNLYDYWETNFISLCGRKTTAKRKEEIAIEAMRIPSDVIYSDLNAFTAFDIRGRLSEIRFPVVFITGSDDYAVTPEVVQNTIDILNCHTALKVLDGVGHFPHMEAPEQVAEAIFTLLPQVLEKST